MTKRRIAIIGLGQVTHNIHLPAYARLRDRLEIVGGCEVNAAVRESAARSGRYPAVFAEAQEMIERTRPDLVAVCTPPALHREHCGVALEAGCHVFCEKPFAETLADADAVTAQAVRLGRTVVVNNQFYRMNVHMAARERIDTPDFGRLLHVHAWQTFRPTPQTEADWRGRMRRRLCLEFGVHAFDLIRFFFGAEPSRVMAHIPPPVPGSVSDAINVIALEFPDGRSASILLDRLSKGPETYLEMRLDGEHAAIHTRIGGEMNVSFGLHTRERRPFFGVRFAKGGCSVLQNGLRERVLARDGLNPFATATAAHLSDFLDALEAGREPRGSARDNRNTLALALAAYDSAERGCGVDLSEYAAPSLPEPMPLVAHAATGEAKR